MNQLAGHMRWLHMHMNKGHSMLFGYLSTLEQGDILPEQTSTLQSWDVQSKIQEQDLFLCSLKWQEEPGSSVELL